MWGVEKAGKSIGVAVRCSWLHLRNAHGDWSENLIHDTRSLGSFASGALAAGPGRLPKSVLRQLRIPGEYLVEAEDRAI
jgi:hypothetical protein